MNHTTFVSNLHMMSSSRTSILTFHLEHLLMSELYANNILIVNFAR